MLDADGTQKVLESTQARVWGGGCPFARLAPGTIVQGAATSVRLLVASRGNEFMASIAHGLANGFRDIGIEAETVLDGVPAPHRPQCLQVIIAPHEYIPLFLLERHSLADVREMTSSAHLLNVEQPGSPWFELTCDYAPRSRGVFDISPVGAAALAGRGIDALHVPLWMPAPAGPLPPASSRPSDVLFLGRSSARRDAFLAEQARAFDGLTCRFVLASVTRPRRENTPGYVHGEALSDLLRDSAIVLNLHADEARYFEWHRAMLALTHGCAFVTESSRGYTPLRAGEHFVMAPASRLAEACRTLLDDRGALDRVSVSGRRFATDINSFEPYLRAMLDRNDGRAGRPSPGGRSAGDTLLAARRSVLERLRQSLAARADGTPDWTVRDNEAWGAGATPAVSVIVTLYNYEAYIEECVQSVIDSDPVPGGVEVVVVDDCSSDASHDRALALSAGSTIPMRLVGKHRNTGLADARNVGVAEARAPFVFMLDADNSVFPRCLVDLHAALSSSSHAACYGMIQRFDDEAGETAGLLSHLPWSEPDLVRAPYIDAMALFRREALDAVGGYSIDLVEHGWFGWEDYDLWLKLASRGQSAWLVPRILSAYRVHGASMLAQTNRTSVGLARHFHEKFRSLVDAHPGAETYFGFAPPQADTSPTRDQPGPTPAELERDQLQSEVDALRASLSWRITSPLRLIYRALTGRS